MKIAVQEQTRKRFFEKKHICDFVFQKQSMYILIFYIQNITEACIICVYVLNKKLCLRIQEQHSCLILVLTSYHVPPLRYRAHAKKCKPLLHGAESLKHNDIEIFD